MSISREKVGGDNLRRRNMVIALLFTAMLVTTSNQESLGTTISCKREGRGRSTRYFGDFGGEFKSSFFI